MLQSKAFGALPPGAASCIQPYELNMPEDDIQRMRDLLKLSCVAGPVYENSLPNEGRNLGLRRDWLLNAKKTWETDFDWRATETRINGFPNFMARINDEAGTFDIHFVGLFSNRTDAVPVVFIHGWPGSFLEFLPMLELFKQKYSPESLPYHIIIPSLPGFTLSSMPLLNRDFSQVDAARVFNRLMVDLGFGSGYVAQGGDIGSRVARALGVNHAECKAVHLNFCPMGRPASISDDSALTEVEKKGIVRGNTWKASGNAYALEQATRPSTIGFVLSSNPLALLAWIGEKFLEWTDEAPNLNTILEAVSLYWLTGTAHSNFWSYRFSFGPGPLITQDDPRYHITVPFGFSYYPKETAPTPISWVATTGSMRWSRSHDKGGHFAALECPKEFMDDIEAFVAEMWK